MHSLGRWIGLVGMATVLQGCASSSPEAPTASLSTATAAPSDGSPVLMKTAYTLSGNEIDYDCKKLTGIMQLRILEIRDEQERNRSSGLSRLLQSAFSGITGGSTAGIDPQGRYAKDIAMLKAYNAQLAAKGCKTYDLNAEFAQTDWRTMPAATVESSAIKKN